MTEDKLAKSHAYFDTVAPEWDEVRKTLFRDEVREKSLRAAGVELGRMAGQVAIDVGAGSGFLSEALLAAGLHVIAIDRSAPMQEEMRRKFMDAIARGTLELRQGESEALAVEDGIANLAMANMYVHHVERPGAAIAEMARALKPGGRLVITDMNHHGLDWVLDQYHDRWPGFHQKDVRGWLEEAGLHNVTVRDLEERCDAVSDATGEVVPVTMFVAVGEK